MIVNDAICMVHDYQCDIHFQGTPPDMSRHSHCYFLHTSHCSDRGSCCTDRLMKDIYSNFHYLSPFPILVELNKIMHNSWLYMKLDKSLFLVFNLDTFIFLHWVMLFNSMISKVSGAIYDAHVLMQHKGVITIWYPWYRDHLQTDSLKFVLKYNI